MSFQEKKGEPLKEFVRAATSELCNTYARVAVPIPVFKPLTYEVPISLRELATIGKRVAIPLGNRKAYGYIVGLCGVADHPDIKPIADVLDSVPLFPASMVPFFQWIADYYIHPIGSVIKAALPGGLEVKHVTTWHITDKGRNDLASDLSKDLIGEKQRTILHALQSGPLRSDKLSDKLKGLVSERACMRIVQEMILSGWISQEQACKHGRVRPKMELCVTQTIDGSFASGLSPAKARIMSLLDVSHPVSLSSLKIEVPSAARVVKDLAQQGLISVQERQVFRDPFGEPIEPDVNVPELTDEQRNVLEALESGLGKGFHTYLLHGVTGSGKTEVYLRAVDAVLKKNGNAVVLVPELSLITQTERIFRARFGDCVALLHSGLSDGEKLDQWMRIVLKEAKVAIGARSAVFAPFERVSLIIVDEEHDDSYKQGSQLRYNARDLAVMRAKRDDGLALLGSATPSVQSYTNSLTKKFSLLTMKRRVGNQSLPEVKVVDLRPTEESRANNSLISNALQHAVAATLERKEQVLLFLNRRGFANYPVCTRCAAPVQCKNCDITMTLHQKVNAFVCHYCGYTRGEHSACSVCGCRKLKLLGSGTEKVEEKIAELFPSARVARIDRDTTSHKGSLIRILKQLRDREIDILVGTQMVAKGHHYPNITLVGIICADLSLNFPDFRSGERTFQLLAQVAGRAGRGTGAGQVILQTYNPDHFCMMAATKQDYEAFYEEELKFRRALSYPPFSRLVQLVVIGSQPEAVSQQAKRLAELCAAIQKERMAAGEANSLSILGPAPAPLARLKGQYRWQILIKGQQTSSLHSFVYALLARLSFEAALPGTKVVVDIDPVDML